jgi:Spy/CpxP family protein refolding chaperone
MKRLSILLLIVSLFAQFSTIDAQKKRSKEERQQWFNEMRQYKHNFLIKELELNEKQQKAFFPIYDAMEEETYKLHHGTRKLQRELSKKDADVTDIEYEKAAEALFELKYKEAQIELKYFEQSKNVLTKKQLFLLKKAEDKYTRHLMRQHDKQKKNRNKKEKKD